MKNMLCIATTVASLAFVPACQSGTVTKDTQANRKNQDHKGAAATGEQGSQKPTDEASGMTGSRDFLTPTLNEESLPSANSLGANGSGASVTEEEAGPTIHMEVPVTPFANMASGYQATNPGFRAFLKDESGRIIAAGAMSMQAVIDGRSDDASRGSAYGRLILKIALGFVAGDLPESQGPKRGALSICMSADPQAAMEASACRQVSGNLHPERPFQWLDKAVDYRYLDGLLAVTRFYGQTGEGGTASQIALAIYHPAFAFAAPGKAFKDFQSPVVLDLDDNGRLDLTDVWDEDHVIHFDLDGNGQRVRTGWVKSQDGFLVMDRNGNGVIDDGRELFGEYTAKAESAGEGRTFANGFAALADLDRNQDGVIDSSDADFKKLEVWRDLNGDGVSQAGELESLQARGIASLGLDYEHRSDLSGTEDTAGNEVRLIGSYGTRDGKKHLLGDVWFKQRRFGSPQIAADKKH